MPEESALDVLVHPLRRFPFAPRLGLHHPSFAEGAGRCDQSADRAALSGLRLSFEPREQRGAGPDA
eukprot:1004324-Pelagomonas_calceolata.AAC.5